MATTTTPQKYSGGNIAPLSGASHQLDKLVTSNTDEPNSVPRDIKIRLSRNLVFTSFNLEPPIFDASTMKFLAYEPEICPTTGKQHWQGFVCWKNAKSGKASSTALTLPGQKGVWNEPMRGSLTQNVIYCSKELKLEKFGKAPEQGARTDLIELRDRILDGLSVEEILIDNPVMYHQYGRTLEKIEEIRQRKIRRTEAPTCTWIYGKTDCGKSHDAFMETTEDNSYIYPYDNGWWDGYVGQEIVIFNDYRGEIPYNILLMLTDKWPNSVKRRGRAPMPFTSKRIIITSILSPIACYPQRESDSIDQLLRRLTVIHKESKTVSSLV